MTPTALGCASVRECRSSGDVALEIHFPSTLQAGLPQSADSGLRATT
jgi:hypothetical protein